MSIDVQGMESSGASRAPTKRLRRAMATVFILVDHERLVARMRARAKDHEDEIAIATAEAELRRRPSRFSHRRSHRAEDFAALLAIMEQARAGRFQPKREVKMMPAASSPRARGGNFRCCASSC